MSETFMALKYMTIPYKHQGRTLEGVDCWGLIKLIYKHERNIELWDIGEDYPEDWSYKGKDLFMENYRKQWKKISSPEVYDLVLIRNGNGTVNHAGIMLSDRTFLHCIKAGVSVSRVTDKIWKSRIVGYYRYKNDNN